MPKEVRHISKAEIRDKFNRDIRPKIGSQYRANVVLSRNAPQEICITHGKGTKSLKVEITDNFGRFVGDCHTYADHQGNYIGQLDPKTIVDGNITYRVLGDFALPPKY